MYRYGRGVEQSDELAIKWYKRASNKNEIGAKKALEELRNKK